MTKRTWIALAIAATVFGGAALYGRWRWGSGARDPRNELLATLPADADALVYVDTAKLRNSVFLKELIAWAPGSREDPEYAQFVRETGFDYARDLDQVALSIEKKNESAQFFAIVQGRFDQKRIAALAESHGAKEKRQGHEIFRVQLLPDKQQIRFAFLGKHRIALSNSGDLANELDHSVHAMDVEAWRGRFQRLAGSPVFAVIRQDASAGEALAQRAPGGFRSPQLASLLGQLKWITLAGMPDGAQMQIIAEGETPDASLAMQLSDFLNGVVLLAEAGLNDPKVQAHLDPELQQAYQQLLKSVEVSRINRGESKSVRAVILITPKILQAARTIQPEPAPAPLPQDQNKNKKEGKRATSQTPATSH